MNRRYYFACPETGKTISATHFLKDGELPSGYVEIRCRYCAKWHRFVLSKAIRSAAAPAKKFRVQ